MAKSKESFGKKEREKKKQKQQADKLEKKLERRAAGQAGKSLDDMLAYVDEFGNLSSSPPEPRKTETPVSEFLYTGIPVREPEDPQRQGRVDFFNETKGFGFILDMQTKQRIFVHQSQASEVMQENDKVSFEMERGPKGPIAINVKKIK
ncbi:MAG TPA: cold shock domain-containing protein [Sediminibacterium sp.]